MTRAKLLVIGVAALVLAGGGAAFTLAGRGAEGRQLVGTDLALTRREALTLFPRGVPVKTAREGLRALGFLCTPVHLVTPNVNAPFVECDSSGRGYPDTPRTAVTVMGRNGALSDIAVGRGVDAITADARTPEPRGGSMH